MRMTKPLKEEKEVSHPNTKTQLIESSFTLWRALHLSIQQNYLSEKMFGAESHFCFTVSPSLELPAVFWLVLCLFGFLGEGRFFVVHFQDPIIELL